MIKYLIVVEETPTGFLAYSPDLDGCVATGSSRADVEKNMREAIEFHLDGLRRDGYEVPKPHTYPAFYDLQS
jgi:predicted RNase H-like HicB family nuclease